MATIAEIHRPEPLFGVGKLPLSGLEDDAGELVWCAKWRIALPAPRCYCFS